MDIRILEYRTVLVSLMGLDGKKELNASRDQRWGAMMRAAQDGDNGAYAALLTELLPVLRGTVANRWRNHQDVEDVVQEILLSLHSVRHTYDPARPFMPWLMTIAMRRSVDASRRMASRSPSELIGEIVPETFSGVGTKSFQETSDDREAIRAALLALPHGQRQAVELLKVEGLSLREASGLTGKSVASLKVTVHRALKAMKKALRKERTE